MKGKIIIISGPSGVGKTTLYHKILEKFHDKLGFSVSATTRKKRTGEKDKREYFFLSKDEFEQKIKEGAFLEYACVHGNYYGTLFSELYRIQEENKTILLDIDVQGLMALRKKGLENVSIFIFPPNLKVLTKRLVNRATDNEASIARRLKTAEQELQEAKNFDYELLNDDLDECLKKLEKLIVKILES